jgi:hypothetical protein
MFGGEEVNSTNNPMENIHKIYHHEDRLYLIFIGFGE